jgi:hypothetical protein
MNDSLTHIPFEKLTDIAEQRLDQGELESCQSHLSTCSKCSAELGHLQQVLSLMRSDNSEDAPRDVLFNAVNLFRAGREPKEPSLIRRLIATLSFDSLSVAPAFGVRSGQSASRQLLYSAEENDLDLRITRQDNNWVIAGQVLRQDCAGGRVEVDGPGGLTEVALNETCEFTLPAMTAGNYRLLVRLSDIEIEVPRLEIKS